MINNKERAPMEHYSQKYAALAPEEITARCGAGFDAAKKRFSVTMLGFRLYAAWPCFSLSPERADCPAALTGTAARLLIIRYLTEGAGAPASGRFLSYRELPWGEAYDAAFQGRCIKRLAFTFGSRPEAFTRAAERLGGTPIGVPDASSELPFFESVRIRAIVRAGDEDFPPSAQLMFSDNAAAAFTAEDLAVAGDVLIAALKESA